MIGSVNYMGVDESVVHVLWDWECPIYDSIRCTSVVELENLLRRGRSFEEFSTLDNLNWHRYDLCYN